MNKPPLPSIPAGSTQGEHVHADHSQGDHPHAAPDNLSHSHADQTHAAHDHPHHPATRPALLTASPLPSVLAWPAWLRVLSVLPVLLLLWLAVAWASVEVAPW